MRAGCEERKSEEWRKDRKREKEREREREREGEGERGRDGMTWSAFRPSDDTCQFNY